MNDETLNLQTVQGTHWYQLIVKNDRNTTAIPCLSSRLTLMPNMDYKKLPILIISTYIPSVQMWIRFCENVQYDKRSKWSYSVLFVI